MKNLKFIISCLLICTAFSLVSCGSETAEVPIEPLQSMTVAADLSNQRVTALAEDSLGHIWIGTFRGLNRYNGHNYHQYICTDSAIDLPDNQINDLYNDSRNRLWVATINGVAIYDNNNHFHSVPQRSSGSPHASQILESKGRDPKVYVNYNQRLDIYDEEAKELRTVLPHLNSDGAYSLSCHFDRRNKLWVISNNTLRCYQPDNYEMIDSVRLPVNVNTHYMDVDNDCIWLGGDRYLAVYDMRNHMMRQLPHTLLENQVVSKANITNIHPYEGGYWLLNTSNNGLIVYNSLSGRVWREGEPGYPFDLPHFRITNFFTDSHKNLWVGSYDHGCAVINKYQKQFNSNTALHNFINERAVHSLDFDSKGNLWMAAGFEGALVYNTATGEAHRVDPHRLSGDNAPNASVSFVKESKDGNIWLASLLESKVWRCSWSNGDLQVIKEYPVAVPLSIVEDSKGVLWVSTGTDWLMRYNGQTDSFEYAQVPKTSDNSSFIPGLALGNDKMYVSAFDRPLMQAEYSDNSIRIDTIDVPELHKAVTRGLLIPTDILYDSYGLLWIGTVGNGLLQYDPESGSVTRIAGLPCTDVSSLEEDKQGHIWISTQYGLARYDRTSGRIKCYFANDGIGGNQFYDRASAIMPDGTLVFGGTHGITEFNPINVGTKRKVPLVFEDLKIHNVIVDPLEAPHIMDRNLTDGHRITLDNDENAFSISFAALDYASSEPPSYSYRLEGHDPYWIDARQNNEAYYAKLKPGNYTFRVRISDASNSLVDSEISLPIHINGSVWLSWWAILIYVAVVAVILAIFFRHRYEVLKEQERMRQMLVAMERSRLPEQPVTETSDTEVANTAETPVPAGPVEAPAPQISPSDSKFLQELQALMEAELANPELDVNKLSEMMHISRTKFYYKVKSITGVNPSVFFKTYKLNRAAQLLKEGEYTVSEIAYMTGFATVAHFSTSFKKQFGKTPSDYTKP